MTTWCEAVSKHPNIEIFTPWNQNQRNSAIATVGIKKMSPDTLAERLMKEFNIFTVAINHNRIKGVRITPHIFTPIDDVNNLALALLKIADSN